MFGAIQRSLQGADSDSRPAGKAFHGGWRFLITLSGALLQYRMAASGLSGSRKPMMAVAFAGNGDSVEVQ